jgi:hypothetical protein
MHLGFGVAHVPNHVCCPSNSWATVFYSKYRMLLKGRSFGASDDIGECHL